MRYLLSAPALLFSMGLAACAGNDARVTHEPVKLDLSVVASSSVNPDDGKRAAPIIVRVYELRNADAFNAADFFSLQDKDRTVLTDDLVLRDQFQLRPGEKRAIQRNADQATTALGVLAAYRDLPNSVWRATWTLPPSPTAAWYHRGPKVRLTIHLDTSAIHITDDQRIAASGTPQNTSTAAGAPAGRSSRTSGNSAPDQTNEPTTGRSADTSQNSQSDAQTTR